MGIPTAILGHLRPSGLPQSESAHPRKASVTLIIASRFFRDLCPIPPLYACASPAPQTARQEAARPDVRRAVLGLEEMPRSRTLI